MQWFLQLQYKFYNRTLLQVSCLLLLLTHQNFQILSFGQATKIIISDINPKTHMSIGDSQNTNGDVILCVLVFVAIYAFLASFFEHKKVRFIHETGVAIIIGFLVGLVIFFQFRQYFLRVINFKDTIVFFVLLPPMLFSDGYNLKKRRFFQNMFYINIFGIIGTLINFAVLATLIYLISNFGLIRDLTNFQQIRYLEIWQVLLFAACMCSIEPIATLSEVKPEYHPKLFSIMFGESLMKDAITIKLVVANGSTDTFDFQWYTPFIILGYFFVYLIASICIGVATAIFLTIMFKKSRFILHDKGITEVALIFIFGYMSYIISELCGFSGVVAMLFCGILLSHFNNYNMSPEGVEAAKVTFKSISLIAEGILFVVLGIATWQVKGDSEEGYVIGESITFLLLAFVALMLARAFNIFLIALIFKPCKGDQKWRLNIYELEILYTGGLPKGAVPFALTTSITDLNTPVKVTSLILKSSIILTVFLSGVILNGIIPVFVRNRLKKIKENLSADHPSLFDSLLEKERLAHLKQGAESMESKHFRSTTQKYWRKFDEGILKPMLIYNYSNRKYQIQLEKKKQRKLELAISSEEQERKKEEEKEEKEVSNILDPINEDANQFVDLEENSSEEEERQLEEKEIRRRKTEIKKKRIEARRQAKSDRSGGEEAPNNAKTTMIQGLEEQRLRTVTENIQRQTPAVAHLNEREHSIN